MSKNIFEATTGTLAYIFGTTASGIMRKFKPNSGDAGRVLAVNSDSDGFELIELPDPGDALPTLSGNGGKHLAVNSGGTAVEWVNPPSGGSSLPTLSGNGGKHLAVNSGGTAVEWVNPPSGGGLPTPDADGDDDGKTLKVNDSGAYELMGPFPELPAIPSSDLANKTLGITSAGVLTWFDKSEVNNPQIFNGDSGITILSSHSGSVVEIDTAPEDDVTVMLSSAAAVGTHVMVVNLGDGTIKFEHQVGPGLLAYPEAWMKGSGKAATCIRLTDYWVVVGPLGASEDSDPPVVIG